MKTKFQDAKEIQTIEVEDNIVTSMTEGVVPEPEPIIPQPSPYEQLRADVDFIMAMEGYI